MMMAQVCDLEVGDFELQNYDPHPHIPGKVAI
jgi:thymidylate synthase